MSKYIIELDDRIKLVASVGVTENGVVYTTSDYVHNLEELNSDYINEHFGELQDEAYQRGLEDAWEAARKIVVATDHGGIASETLCEIFGTRGYSYIMQENTAQQAIDKIKAYEDNDRIEVGDEVAWNSDVIVITRVYEDGGFNWCDGISQDGRAFHVLAENVRKTGKHYDIQSILEAMQK